MPSSHYRATVSPSFNITTSAVAAQTQVKISGSYNGVAQTATITVNPPQVASVTLSPAGVTGGTTTTRNTVTLDQRRDVRHFLNQSVSFGSAENRQGH